MLEYLYLIVADARWFKDLTFFIHTCNLFVQVGQSMDKSQKNDWKSEVKLKEFSV